MTRVLALLAAAAMVAGALVVRGQLDGGASAGTPQGSGGEQPGEVVCDEALDALCGALQAAGQPLSVEPAGATFDRLSRSGAQDGGAPEAWVTVAPWPAMVDEARARGGLQPLFAAGSVEDAVGSSPLVLLAWADRSEVLLAECATAALTWGCVAPVAGDPWADLGGSETWGPVKPGLDHPARSSLGLAALAQATAEELGTTEFGTRSLGEGAYLDWLTALDRAVPDYRPSAGTVLAAMLQFGQASYDVVATTEAAAGTALATSARADQLRVHYPQEPVTADVVVAAPAPVDADRLREAVAAELAEQGWHTAETSPPALGDAAAGTAALPTSPAGATLPGPGAMTALRSTFTDVVRR